MTAPSRSVVVVIDRVSPYTLPVMAGIRDVLENTHVPLLVHVNDYFAHGVPLSLARRVEDGEFQGMISLPLSTTELHREMQAMLLAHPELPVVALSGGPGNGTSVVADNRSGMRALMAHLLDEQGVRRIALVRGVPHHPDSIEREAVVREELARRWLELPPELVVEGDFDREIGYRAVSSLLRAGARFEAVVALNDHSAVGALDAVLDHGLLVPEDLIVTGFDDDASLRARRPLTTVDQNLRGQGATAARLLLARMDGGATVGQVAVPARLVVRGSSLRPDAGRATGAGHLVPPVPAYLHELDTLDNVLGMNRSFMTCQTEQDVMRALATCLPRLEITHCYVVLHQPAGADDAPAGKRLALVYPEPAGPAAGPDGEIFPADALLPPRLDAELSEGTLLMQSLSMAGDELGYVLYRQPALSDVAAEVLRMDLTRALDGVARHRHLERLVAERTETLEQEISVRLRAEAELSVVNTALSKANRDLSALNAELRRSAELDGLTGLANRRAFDSYLMQVWQDGLGVVSVVFVDVDHFKLFNDHYGHLRGDDALRTVADALRRSLRGPIDLAARFGGEEFVLVLPATPLEGGRMVARRIRRLVRGSAVPNAGSPVSPWLTVSQCVASADPGHDDPRHLLDAADQGLYRAKAQGRDQIMVIDPELGPWPDPTTPPSGNFATPR